MLYCEFLPMILSDDFSSLLIIFFCYSFLHVASNNTAEELNMPTSLVFAHARIVVALNVVKLLVFGMFPLCLIFWWSVFSLSTIGLHSCYPPSWNLHNASTSPRRNLPRLVLLRLYRINIQSPAKSVGECQDGDLASFLFWDVYSTVTIFWVFSCFYFYLTTIAQTTKNGCVHVHP